MSIGSTIIAMNEFKNRRKLSYNFANNNFFKSRQLSYDVNFPYNNSTIKTEKNNNLEQKKTLISQTLGKAMSNINQEESSELESYHFNKTINNINNIINKNNNTSIRYSIKDTIKDKKNNSIIKEKLPDLCSIHIGKEIEFYCENCSSLACSLCLIDFHNGHNFGLLYNAIDKIRKNVSDADNILNELLYQNYNNQKLLNLVLNEINDYKNGQNLIVMKNFEEIIKKINQIKQNIIDEFENKYNSELKKYEKFQNSLDEDIKEIKKTKLIINEIYDVLDMSSEVKILKDKNNYDNFLYWCNVNIKRLYKN
jgi:hypothetical protein